MDLYVLIVYHEGASNMHLAGLNLHQLHLGFGMVVCSIVCAVRQVTNSAILCMFSWK